jgi:hypothetical protein
LYVQLSVYLFLRVIYLGIWLIPIYDAHAQAGNFPARPLYTSSTTTLGDIRHREGTASVISSGLFTIHDTQNRLTVRAPSSWHPLARELHQRLKRTKLEYGKLFGDLSAVETTLILMPAEEFYVATGTPRWTNAIFFRNRIVIPVEPTSEPDLVNLDRSLRHEFLHAVTYTLTNGTCPGWLDEGLAQWIEGEENPALRPALVRWLSRHEALPLRILRGGFTKLDPDLVPAAYSQSLFTAKILLKKHGFASVRKYLDLLASGNSNEQAFQGAFNQDFRRFERDLGRTLMHWQHHPEENPLLVSMVKAQ